MPTENEVTITELEEFEPSRVDGVGTGCPHNVMAGKDHFVPITTGG